MGRAAAAVSPSDERFEALFALAVQAGDIDFLHRTLGVTVQRALGLARATTTLNTYAHLWSTAEDRTRQAAGELMTTVLRGGYTQGP